MGRVVERRHCPVHEERTESFVIYDDGRGFCFGCGHSARVWEEHAKPIEKEKEDLNATFNYIRSLPIQPIRGLELPCDARGYYVVWPNSDYYKHRVRDADSVRSRYIGPTGHRKPLYWAKQLDVGPLVICEGEINALSLAVAGIPASIVSPGGAGDFYSKRAIEEDLITYRRYQEIRIIVDKDAAGAKAAIMLKSKIQGVPKVFIHLVDKDANEVLCEEGKEGLKRWYLELP